MEGFKEEVILERVEGGNAGGGNDVSIKTTILEGGEIIMEK